MVVLSATIASVILLERQREIFEAEIGRLSDVEKPWGRIGKESCFMC
jgi:hypothetical protein